MGELVILSDYRAAKRRAAAGPIVAAGELFVGTGFMAALAWIQAMEDAADLFAVPWPGGVDDLPV